MQSLKSNSTPLFEQRFTGLYLFSNTGKVKVELLVQKYFFQIYEEKEGTEMIINF